MQLTFAQQTAPSPLVRAADCEVDDGSTAAVLSLQATPTGTDNSRLYEKGSTSWTDFATITVIQAGVSLQLRAAAYQLLLDSVRLVLCTYWSCCYRHVHLYLLQHGCVMPHV
jgi:hypothetical protein